MPFQEIRKIKYALNATTSFYQICYIVCRSEMNEICYVGVVLIWLMEYQCLIACGSHF